MILATPNVQGSVRVDRAALLATLMFFTLKKIGLNYTKDLFHFAHMAVHSAHR